MPDRRLQIAGACGLAAIAAGIGLVLAPTLTVFAIPLAALGALVLHDRRRRETWERSFAKQVRALTLAYERLTRDAAASRNDIADLKKARNAAPATPPFRPAAEKPAPPPPPAAKPAAPILRATPKEQPSEKPEEKEYSDTVILELIHQAVRDDRVDAFLQPVVTLPHRKVAFFEMFARIRTRPGRHMPANDYMPLARKESVAGGIDNLLLLRCLEILRDSGADARHAPAFFLNVAPSTLRDATYISELLAFLERHHTLARKLVFELSLTDALDLDDKTAAVAGALQKLGCRLSADHARVRLVDVTKLARGNFAFLKLDAARLREEAAARNGISRLRALRQNLRNAGIGLIIEKIETDQTLRGILGYDADYGQGYLFGRPEPYTAAFKDKLKLSA